MAVGVEWEDTNRDPCWFPPNPACRTSNDGSPCWCYRALPIRRETRPVDPASWVASRVFARIARTQVLRRIRSRSLAAARRLGTTADGTRRVRWRLIARGSLAFACYGALAYLIFLLVH